MFDVMSERDARWTLVLSTKTDKTEQVFANTSQRQPHDAAVLIRNGRSPCASQTLKRFLTLDSEAGSDGDEM